LTEVCIALVCLVEICEFWVAIEITVLITDGDDANLTTARHSSLNKAAYYPDCLGNDKKFML
jgi:hypothetical protein